MTGNKSQFALTITISTWGAINLHHIEVSKVKYDLVIHQAEGVITIKHLSGVGLSSPGKCT